MSELIGFGLHVRSPTVSAILVLQLESRLCKSCYYCSIMFSPPFSS
ncbi:hypothetical protein PanWU01x14_011100 [Parasponia andersonii]|uniref:Uncharacterized protein n=1 Tax=Parasponia andersonii TaxID=3476 RepID=A0A2P5E1E9_PARAD|nr:hypothetical protein PanWU01x14_011100 [Parasponia andersonii]